MQLSLHSLSKQILSLQMLRTPDCPELPDAMAGIGLRRVEEFCRRWWTSNRHLPLLNQKLFLLKVSLESKGEAALPLPSSSRYNFGQVFTSFNKINLYVLLSLAFFLLGEWWVLVQEVERAVQVLEELKGVSDPVSCHLYSGRFVSHSL